MFLLDDHPYGVQPFGVQGAFIDCVARTVSSFALRQALFLSMRKCENPRTLR